MVEGDGVTLCRLWDVPATIHFPEYYGYELMLHDFPPPLPSFVTSMGKNLIAVISEQS